MGREALGEAAVRRDKQNFTRGSTRLFYAEEAAQARTWGGQEEPQIAPQQETPALGGCCDTRVGLGLPAGPSRKASGVSLFAGSQCTGQPRTLLPWLWHSRPPGGGQLDGGRRGGRGVFGA